MECFERTKKESSYTINSCQNTDVPKWKGEPSFSPLLLTITYPSFLPTPLEKSCTGHGWIQQKDFLLKQLQFAFFPIIFIAFGVYPKRTIIIRFAGRKLNVYLQKNICVKLDREKSAISLTKKDMKLPSGSGVFGNTPYWMKRILRRIWITSITIRSNMVM